MYLKPMRDCLALALVAALGRGASHVQDTRCLRGHGIHDVWADAAPNGPVWISAQGSGHLGILDPKSGEIEFVALAAARRRMACHGRADGAPWLTDGGQTPSCASTANDSAR